MGDRKVEVIDILSSAVYSAGSAAYSSSFLVDKFIEGQIYINVTAESGTSTLDVVIEHSPDNTTFYTHTTIAQITATGQTSQAITNIGKYIRIKYTVGGTSFTFAITGSFKN